MLVRGGDTDNKHKNKSQNKGIRNTRVDEVGITEKVTI